ncbi:type II toxin-antitoxin system RelE/ParE family toxin [Pseudoduganella sp. FT55W]|uniref:Type II toxin-antitoxin system RelE/ParE family toxin n=1 Tax=Duganella rivi TaxID=2666083 RepID=A0A7X4KA85_9BURK|nr:type II toxin-antitoxin system RelE/ParE family toxin [Duganella rivi]MYM65949.1 type II toxin-antitoxin system RelE/ParE family toxin [Duganella rivi]
MTLPITFDPAATADVVDAVHWYEGQRKGLGARFYAEMTRVVKLAAAHPLRYPLTQSDIRRISLHRFPYSIYFRVEPKRLVVLAVFHARRNPSRLTP